VRCGVNLINKDDLIKLSVGCADFPMPESFCEDLKHQEGIHPEAVPYYRFLYLLAARVKPMLCVELGTNRGMGSGCLAIGNPAGRVVSLDIESKAGACLYSSKYDLVERTNLTSTAYEKIKK